MIGYLSDVRLVLNPPRKSEVKQRTHDDTESLRVQANMTAMMTPARVQFWVLQRHYYYPLHLGGKVSEISDTVQITQIPLSI